MNVGQANNVGQLNNEFEWTACEFKRKDEFCQLTMKVGYVASALFAALGLVFQILQNGDYSAKVSFIVSVCCLVPTFFITLIYIVNVYNTRQAFDKAASEVEIRRQLTTRQQQQQQQPQYAQVGPQQQMYTQPIVPQQLGQLQGGQQLVQQPQGGQQQVVQQPQGGQQQPQGGQQQQQQQVV